MAAFINAAHLGGGDPFQLPFAAQIGLEFGEHAKHVEKGLAARRRGINRLLGRAQGDALGLQRVYDVLQVGDGASEPVDAGWPVLPIANVGVPVTPSLSERSSIFLSDAEIAASGSRAASDGDVVTPVVVSGTAATSFLR